MALSYMQMVMVKTIGRNSLPENGTNAPFLEVKYSYAKPNKPRVQAYSNGSGSGSVTSMYNGTQFQEQQVIKLPF